MQLDYNDMRPSVEGGLGDAEFHDIVSALASEAIRFGRGVVVLSDGTVALPSDTTEKFLGISVKDNRAAPNDTAIAQYESGDEVLVMRQGRIWVLAEDAVDPLDQVWMRTGDSYQGHTPGSFRTDDDGTSDPRTVRITNARWVNVTTVAGLALLELNLP